MSFHIPSFLLRVARALVEEVAQSTKPVLDAVRERKLEEWKAMVLTSDLVTDLRHAERLCDNAIKADPNVELNDGTTPLQIKADIFFQMALIEMCRRNFKEAVKYFEQSLSYEPDQAAYYIILGFAF